MIKKKSREVLRVELNNLDQVAYFCTNNIECRRVQIMRYFGEKFNPEECMANKRSICDNCVNKKEFKKENYTVKAKLILQSIFQVNKSTSRDFTLNYFIDVIKGSNNQKINSTGHNSLPCYAICKDLAKVDIERLLRKMKSENLIEEEIKILQHHNVVEYIRLGPNVKSLLEDKIKFEFEVILSVKNTQQKLPIREEDPDEAKLFELAYQALEEVSREIGKETNVHYHNVIPLQSLREMSTKLPTDRESIMKIPHVTLKWFNLYGERYIEQIKLYSSMLQDQRELKNSEMNLNFDEDIDIDNDVDESFSINDDSDFSYQQPSTSNYFKKKNFSNNRGNYANNFKKRKFYSAKAKNIKKAKTTKAPSENFKPAAKNKKSSW